MYTFTLSIAPSDRTGDLMLDEVLHLPPLDYFIDEVQLEVSAYMSRYYPATLTSPEEPRELIIDSVTVTNVFLYSGNDRVQLDEIPDGLDFYLTDEIESQSIEAIAELEQSWLQGSYD
jgi:hypothetical protein